MTQNMTIAYDVTGRQGSNVVRKAGTITLPVSTAAPGECGPAFDLRQIAERIEKGCATPEDFARLPELTSQVGSASVGNEVTQEAVIDAVMARLASEGIQASDPGADGWYIDRNDLDVQFDGTEYTVQGSATWG